MIAVLAGRTTEREQFLAVMCADEELLRTEFAAIIQANWDEPPPRRGAAGPTHRRQRAAHPGHAQRPCGPRQPLAETGGQVRQRSPPIRGATVNDENWEGR